MNVQNLVRYTAIALVASLLFLPFLGNVHLFDWDEINFAECAREMIVSGDYLRPQIDFQPFWEKPPLFIWMQVLSMKLFGIHEYAARFPNAFMGIVTLMTLFYAGKRVAGERMATWWTVLYAATWLPHFYFKSGIIDPTFNFFIFLSFFQVHLLRYGRYKFLHALYGGLFLGLAVLTKGPAAALVAVVSLVVYLVVNKGLWGHKLKYFFILFFAALLPFALWFGATIMHYGWDFGQWFTTEFITYQIRLLRTEDADHGGPFFYHFIVLLIGCFPASVFLFQYTRKRTTDNEAARDFTRWMWILFFVTLIIFSIVKTKIVHYSSLCYFPLTYLAALKIDQIASGEVKMKTGVKTLLIIIGSIWAALLIALPLIGENKSVLIPYINDPFAVANLNAPVSWTSWECFWGIVLFAGLIASVIFMKRNFARAMGILCLVQIIMIQITILHFTPKIEAYSQRTAIRFFKSFQGLDVYVQPLDYKSYAHLFYTMKKPAQNKNYYTKGWLLYGKIDKPAFFICKITSAETYRKMPQLEEIGHRNGFVFFRRKPANPTEKSGD